MTSRYHGSVYVVERNGLYKIGFSRGQEVRRARDARGRLLFTIPAGNQPSVLERIIQLRFAIRRINNHPRCEWFALRPDDVEWLRGLAAYLTSLTTP